MGTALLLRTGGREIISVPLRKTSIEAKPKWSPLDPRAIFHRIESPGNGEAGSTLRVQPGSVIRQDDRTQPDFIPTDDITKKWSPPFFSLPPFLPPSVKGLFRMWMALVVGVDARSADAYMLAASVVHDTRMASTVCTVQYTRQSFLKNERVEFLRLRLARALTLIWALERERRIQRSVCAYFISSGKQAQPFFSSLHEVESERKISKCDGEEKV